MIKNLNQNIKSINRCLPQYALRRNSIYYEYVCYINNIYTLLICELYDEVELFINRADKYIKKNEKNIDFENQYIIKSKEFLNTIRDYLDNNNLVK